MAEGNEHGALAKRLRTVRRAAGWSLRDLERRIHNRVSAQAISQYERGESVPSPSVLEALAMALNVSVGYLTNTREIVLERVRFRSKRRLGRRQQVRVHARVVRRLERHIAIEEALRLRTSGWDRPRGVPVPTTGSLGEAEQVAGRIRAQWGLGSAPIWNLAETLEDRGLAVLFMSLGTVDGMTARARQRDRGGGRQWRVVVVNESKPGDRQRFTMAHELGHMALDAPPSVAEVAAHRFAAALLMPRETVVGEVGWRRESIGWSELFGLQRFFGVSAQALVRRCQDVGAFADPLARLLYSEFARRRWSRPPFEEPVTIPRERPQRFERLCFRGLAEGVISTSDAMELLGMTIEDLVRHMSSVDHASEETSTPHR